jgi:hypothetical protein
MHPRGAVMGVPKPYFILFFEHLWKENSIAEWKENT